jgi:hypothetical protein
VRGPADAVHALHVKIGASDESSGSTPVVALEFDAARLARFGRAEGFPPALFPTDTTLTLPALLERVVWLDNRLDLIAMFDPAKPEPRWSGSLVVDEPGTTSRRHLWMAARSTSDEHGMPVVRAIVADVTAVAPPPRPDPVLEHLSTHTSRGHGSALMDLSTTLMHSFTCRDDPRMSLWRSRNPQLHPSDMPAVVKMLADLADNRAARIDLRIKFADEVSWTTLHAQCTPLPNHARPQAHIDFWIEN